MPIPAVNTRPLLRHPRMLLVAFAAVLTMVFASMPTATADTYSESRSGSEYITRTTTLLYKRAHGNFNLRVYVRTNGWFGVSDRYSIQMYDKYGRQVWSASNQRDRTYGIGGNVTKIIIKRNSAQGATTYWRR